MSSAKRRPFCLGLNELSLEVSQDVVRPLQPVQTMAPALTNIQNYTKINHVVELSVWYGHVFLVPMSYCHTTVTHVLYTASRIYEHGNVCQPHAHLTDRKSGSGICMMTTFPYIYASYETYHSMSFSWTGLASRVYLTANPRPTSTATAPVEYGNCRCWVR